MRRARATGESFVLADDHGVVRTGLRLLLDGTGDWTPTLPAPTDLQRSEDREPAALPEVPDDVRHLLHADRRGGGGVPARPEGPAHDGSSSSIVASVPVPAGS